MVPSQHGWIDAHWQARSLLVRRELIRSGHSCNTEIKELKSKTKDCMKRKIEKNWIDWGTSAYPEFLLPLWRHETLLGLLACGGFLQTFPDFGLLAVDFGTFLFFRLWFQRERSQRSAPSVSTTNGYVLSMDRFVHYFIPFIGLILKPLVISPGILQNEYLKPGDSFGW